MARSNFYYHLAQRQHSPLVEISFQAIQLMIASLSMPSFPYSRYDLSSYWWWYTASTYLVDRAHHAAFRENSVLRHPKYLHPLNPDIEMLIRI